VLASLPVRRAVVAPLLLTSAYHGRVDIPAVLTEAAALPLAVSLAPVLGPSDQAPISPHLTEALVRQLPVGELDAVVLAAAGTRDPAARSTVEDVANALSARLRLPCTVAYASAAPPAPSEAVERLRASGARRVGMGAYFLAPGLLYDNAVGSARSAGAVAIAEPLGDAPDLVRLVAARVAAGVRGPLASAA
jgi:sirohydrochlorin ferrochelatase